MLLLHQQQTRGNERSCGCIPQDVTHDDYDHWISCNRTQCIYYHDESNHSTKLSIPSIYNTSSDDIIIINSDGQKHQQQRYDSVNNNNNTSLYIERLYKTWWWCTVTETNTTNCYTNTRTTSTERRRSIIYNRTMRLFRRMWLWAKYYATYQQQQQQQSRTRTTRINQPNPWNKCYLSSTWDQPTSSTRTIRTSRIRQQQQQGKPIELVLFWRRLLVSLIVVMSLFVAVEGFQYNHHQYYHKIQLLSRCLSQRRRFVFTASMTTDENMNDSTEDYDDIGSSIGSDNNMMEADNNNNNNNNIGELDGNDIVYIVGEGLDTSATSIDDLNWRVMKLKLEEQNIQRFLKAQPRFLPYKECSRWVQAFNRWQTKEDWIEWIAMGEKRNSYIPSRPDEYYGRLGQWISWEHFLLGKSASSGNGNGNGSTSSKKKKKH